MVADFRSSHEFIMVLFGTRAKELLHQFLFRGNWFCTICSSLRKLFWCYWGCWRVW